MSKEAVRTEAQEAPTAPEQVEQNGTQADTVASTPKEHEAAEVTPLEVTPVEVMPVEGAPGEVTPAESIPGEVTPVEVTPVEATPGEVTPAEAIPAEAIPAEVIPAEVTPAESIPGEVTPVEVTPVEATPCEVTPAEAIPAEFDYDDNGEEPHKEAEIMRPSVLDVEFLAEVQERASNYSSSQEDSPPGRAVLEREEKPTVFFLDGWESIPSLSKISSDVSTRLSASKLRAASVSGSIKTIDHVSFVDPLTGEGTEKPEEEEKQIVKQDEPKQEEEEEEESEEEFVLPAEFDDEENKILEKLTEAESDLALLLQPKVKIETEPTFDWYKKHREHEARRIAECTQHFLRDLINAAVSVAEYKDPNEDLGAKLDKRELLQAIQIKLRERAKELSKRNYLNKEVNLYLERKKAFGQITKEDSVSNIEGAKKFKEALAKLDKLMGKETQMKQAAMPALKNLQDQLFVKQKKLRATLDQFKNKVRKTVGRENFPHLKARIELGLRQMDKLRAEISSIRLECIHAQHRAGLLDKKTEECDNFGGALNIRYYQRILLEILALEKRIEEANVELAKKWSLCTEAVHTISHMREVKSMQSELLDNYKQKLEKLAAEKQRIRELLFQEKITHGRLRDEINQAMLQSGILSRPSLMHDYDETCEILEKKRETLQYKRLMNEELQKKIELLEQELGDNQTL